MSGKEVLSLDEFTIAPRKQRPSLVDPSPRQETARTTPDQSEPLEDREKGERASEASKALRQIKRARMKGASYFVNVNLDRDTKRRLKLAAFNTDTSMQSLMEKAIRQYLDANSY